MNRFGPNICSGDLVSEQLALFALPRNRTIRNSSQSQVVTELLEITEPVKEQLHYD